MSDPVVLLSTGDVVGPAGGVTDNSMVLFSGTSGKIIKGNNAVVTSAGLALLDDVNAAAQRVTLGLGTAATANVTTSATDTTAGRVLKVGDFGLGSTSGIVSSGQDLNTMVTTGFYVVTGPVNGPTGDTTNLMVIGNNMGGGRALQLAQTVNTATYYVRSQSSGTWLPWREIWHNGNLVKTTSATDTTAGSMLKVGDFGLGASGFANPSADLNLELGPNSFIGVTSSTLNTPLASVAGTVLQQRWTTSSGTQITQTFFGIIASNRIFTRTRIGGVWNAWTEIWTTSNLVKTTSATDTTAGSMLKVGDFGLGSITAPVINGQDLNTLRVSGLYYITTPVNGPVAQALYVRVESVLNGAGVERGVQWAAGVASAESPIYVRTQYNGVWGAWKEIAPINSPAFTGTPTAPTAADGTNTTQLANTAFVKTAIDNVNILKSIGIDQTWQDLTGSRTFGVTYTNSTGRPIVVSIGFKSGSGNEHVYFRVNGVVVSYHENDGAGDSIGPVGNIVPAGATYILERAVGSIENWAELR